MDSLESKPFQLILLGIFGLLAFVGLFLFASYSGFGGGKNTVGSVVIWGTLPAESVKAGLDVISQGRKEFKDVGYVEKSATTFDIDLANALASGTGPDLILISEEQLLYEKSKLTIIPYSSIPERTFISTYVPVAELFLSTEGTYGIPLLVDPLVMYVNRSTLSSAGVAEPPSTWEAVTALTEDLTTRTNDLSIVKSTVALGEYANINNARALVSLFLLQAGVPITGETSLGIRASLVGELSGTAAPSSLPPGVSALTFYTQFANPVKTVYSWSRSLPTAREEFLAGDLAFYFGFASEQPFLAAANPNLDLDMASMPQPGTATKVVTYANVYAFAIPKASKNPSGAFSAALGLSEDASLSAIARAAGMAPAKRTLLTPGARDRFEPVFYPAALSGKSWLSPLPGKTDTVFATMIGDITSGRRETEDALRAAEQALNAAMQ